MTTKSPYYAVIFTSKKTDNEIGYEEMSIEMESLAKKQSVFLDMDSARNEIGIAISYWSNLEDIKNWEKSTASNCSKNWEREMVQQIPR